MGKRPPIRDADSKLNRARAEHHAGRLASAARAYDRILMDSPNRADVLRLRGIAARQTGDRALASDLLNRAAVLQPADPAIWNSLGLCLLEEERYVEAGAAFGRTLKLDGRYPGALTRLALARYGDGAAEETAERLQRAAELDDRDARAQAALGCLSFEQGDDVAATRHLRRAAKLDGAYEFGRHCHMGAAFFEHADPARLGELAAEIPEAAGDLPVAASDRPIVTTCCDDAGYTRFARRLIDSIDRNAPGGQFHLHLVNPEPDTAVDLDRLADELQDTALTVTSERTRGRDPRHCDRIRLFRLYQLLRACGGSVFHLDPDSLVLAGLDTLKDAIAAADIALPLRPRCLDINQKVFAAAMALRPTAAASHYLECAAAYMLSVSRGGVPAPQIDQCALFIVYEMLGRAANAPALAPLPPRFADRRFDDSSSVWTAGAGRGFPYTLADPPVA